jgi:hypothetical protein
MQNIISYSFTKNIFDCIQFTLSLTRVLFVGLELKNIIKYFKATNNELLESDISQY